MGLFEQMRQWLPNESARQTKAPPRQSIEPGKVFGTITMVGSGGGGGSNGGTTSTHFASATGTIGNFGSPMFADPDIQKVMQPRECPSCTGKLMLPPDIDKDAITAILGCSVCGSAPSEPLEIPALNRSEGRGGRGSGRTTAQMNNAPFGAVFVAHSRSYAKGLALKIGRQDLEIVSPDLLGNGASLRGRKLSGLIIDHAAVLTSRQQDECYQIQARIKRNAT